MEVKVFDNDVDKALKVLKNKLSKNGLFKELNLSPAQQDQLTQLFLDQQMKAVENAGALFQADGADKTAAAEALAAQLPG